MEANEDIESTSTAHADVIAQQILLKTSSAYHHYCNCCLGYQAEKDEYQFKSLQDCPTSWNSTYYKETSSTALSDEKVSLKNKQ